MSDKLNEVVKNYDDMTNFISEKDEEQSFFESFFDDKKDKPVVRKKIIDAEFSESWQKILISFENIEDYKNFMEIMDNKPVPNLKTIIYERPGTKKDILNFMDKGE